MYARTTALALTIAATLVSYGTLAHASDSDTVGARESAPEWSKADSNRDGFLTKDELVPYPTLGNDFDEIDMDGDNKISEAEYVSWIDSDNDMKTRDRM